VRALFVSSPAAGHVNTLLPLATALADEGHDVAMAVAPELRSRVEAQGLTPLAAGDNMEQWWGALVGRLGPDVEPGGGLPAERILQWFIPRLFAEIGTVTMLLGVVAAIRDWQADIVVHETYAFAGPLAAAITGVPSVHHSLGPPPDPAVIELAADAVSPLWVASGQVPDRAAGLERGLTIEICPAILDPANAPGGRRLRMRPAAQDVVAGRDPPTWLGDLSDGDPVVYATLGTVTNTDVAVFRAIVEGLAELPVTTVLTVGPDNDPAMVGTLPANARVERYIPQSLLLPRAVAVVCHGGSGTLLAALTHGLPVVLIPQGADQFVNVRRAVDAGVGCELQPADVSAEAVRAAVESILGEAAPARQCARAAAAEIAAMPGPAQVAAAFEDLLRTT
jgi:hypothetical protein